MRQSQCMKLLEGGFSMEVDNYGQYYFTYAENGGDILVDGISILDNSDCQYIDDDADMICYTGAYIDRPCPLCGKENPWNDDDDGGEGYDDDGNKIYLCNCRDDDDGNEVLYMYDYKLEKIERSGVVWNMRDGTISCGDMITAKIDYRCSNARLENYKLLIGG